MDTDTDPDMDLSLDLDTLMDPELAAQIRRREHTLGRVRELLIQHLYVRREPDEIDPDCPLFATGLALDSVDAVELVVLLDTELGIKLADEALLRGALRTVNSLVDLILAHTPEPGPGREPPRPDGRQP